MIKQLFGESNVFDRRVSGDVTEEDDDGGEVGDVGSEWGVIVKAMFGKAGRIVLTGSSPESREGSGSDSVACLFEGLLLS